MDRSLGSMSSNEEKLARLGGARSPKTSTGLKKREPFGDNESGMFMHYTLSEDRSGDAESVTSTILSRLGDRRSVHGSDGHAIVNRERLHEAARSRHTYNLHRHFVGTPPVSESDEDLSEPVAHDSHLKPRERPEKSITVKLLLNRDEKMLPTTPLRLMITDLDTADSIAASVRKFYSLCDEVGISFEEGGGKGVSVLYKDLGDGATIFARLTLIQKVPASAKASSGQAANPTSTSRRKTTYDHAGYTRHDQAFIANRASQLLGDSSPNFKFKLIQLRRLISQYQDSQIDASGLIDAVAVLFETPDPRIFRPHPDLAKLGVLMSDLADLYAQEDNNNRNDLLEAWGNWLRGKGNYRFSSHSVPADSVAVDITDRLRSRRKAPTPQIPHLDARKDPNPSIFIQKTISEDWSGTEEENRSRILARLGEKDRKAHQYDEVARADPGIRVGHGSIHILGDGKPRKIDTVEIHI